MHKQLSLSLNLISKPVEKKMIQCVTAEDPEFGKQALICYVIKLYRKMRAIIASRSSTYARRGPILTTLRFCNPFSRVRMVRQATNDV